jgi:hypothetical protein
LRCVGGARRERRHRGAAAQARSDLGGRAHPGELLDEPAERVEVDHVGGRRLHAAIRHGDEEDGDQRDRGEHARDPQRAPARAQQLRRGEGEHDRDDERGPYVPQEVGAVGAELPEHAAREGRAEQGRVEVQVGRVLAVEVELPADRRREQEDEEGAGDEAGHPPPRARRDHERGPQDRALQDGERIGAEVLRRERDEALAPGREIEAHHGQHRREREQPAEPPAQPHERAKPQPQLGARRARGFGSDRGRHGSDGRARPRLDVIDRAPRRKKSPARRNFDKRVCR